MSQSPEAPEPLTKYERSILISGAIWFFLILFAYYVLRPIRAQIGAIYGTENLSGLLTATFLVMLVAVPAYSYFVGKYHRKFLVPIIYAVIVASLIGFCAGMIWAPTSSQIWIARAYYVWTSVFGLFAVSFFWSVAGDMLSTGQGRRVFGYIAGGGTTGGLLGSLSTWLLVDHLGVARLLLLPAILLTLSVGVYWWMESIYQKLGTHEEESSGKATGGNPFAGFTAVFKSRYLFAICIFGVLMATCGTSIYFQQAEIVKSTYANTPFDDSGLDRDSLTEKELKEKLGELQKEASKEASTKFFANVDFVVSFFTLVLQVFVVRWLMGRVGLGASMAILPVAYVIGIAVLAVSPTIGVFAVVAVLVRSTEYGICNPTREVLFTSVDREDRYKAKSCIDTVVRRGGDASVGVVYSGLRHEDYLGLALHTISWITMPFALIWVGLSFFIGSENKKVIEELNDKEASE